MNLQGPGAQRRGWAPRPAALGCAEDPTDRWGPTRCNRRDDADRSPPRCPDLRTHRRAQPNRLPRTRPTPGRHTPRLLAGDRGLGGMIGGGAQWSGHERRARDDEAEREQSADDPNGAGADRLAEDKDPAEDR